MMNDKVKHIVAGLLASGLCALPAYLITNDLFSGLWVCLWVAIAIAACKEWCDNDYSLAGYWDWLDFAATCLGAVLVALVILGMHFGKG